MRIREDSTWIMCVCVPGIQVCSGEEEKEEEADDNRWRYLFFFLRGPLGGPCLVEEPNGD